MKVTNFHRSRASRSSRLFSRRRARSKYIGLAVITLIVTLVLGILGPRKQLVALRKSPSAVQPAPPATASTTLAKEYIYVGGKLVAVEEPAAGGTLAAPVNLIAASLSKSRIEITWTAISGADHYQIERSPNLSSAWTILSSNVPTNNFADISVVSINAYLYRVRAVDVSGGLSPYSNIDVGTAIEFTDDPVERNSTLIRAKHIWELRQAVNAVRAAANLPLVTWTDNKASPEELVGITVLAVHIEELRRNLDEALSRLGVPLSAYSDPVPPGLSRLEIRKIHIDQLRERVK